MSPASETRGSEAILVLGAGLAGLCAALASAAEGRKVRVLAAEPLMAGSASAWAQGGLAAALSPDDSAALHAKDTLEAGAGLVDPAAALRLAEAAPEAVRRLIDLKVPFDRDERGRLVQGLEAAHARARVARVGGDGAGRAILAAVRDAVLQDPLISVETGLEARALLSDVAGRVCGVLAQRGSETAEIFGPAVVLAVGGAGGLYRTTTNPKGAVGAGMALAGLAGAVLADPEFIQFHPTAMDLGVDPAPLASEALRGEGARLVNSEGTLFMEGLDVRGDLAPRDVVARAIAQEIAEGRGAFLDARAAVGAHFPEVFPTVFAACRRGGIDPRVQPIPIEPAAHYHMGGVRADLDGRTDLEGLFAVGECASTGVHGANRLASNSLLEAAVAGEACGRLAAAAAGVRLRRTRARPLARLAASELRSLRRAMSRGCGVVRSEAGLRALVLEIDRMAERREPVVELVAANLIAAAALERRESRGAHHRLDHPRAAPPRRSFLRLDAAGRIAAPAAAALE